MKRGVSVARSALGRELASGGGATKAPKLVTSTVIETLSTRAGESGVTARSCVDETKVALAMPSVPKRTRSPVPVGAKLRPRTTTECAVTYEPKAGSIRTTLGSFVSS